MISATFYWRVGATAGMWVNSLPCIYVMGIDFTSGTVPMVWYFIVFHFYIDHLDHVDKYCVFVFAM